MIKLKQTDRQPINTRLTVIAGDDMFCYFADDQEVIDMEKARADELLCRQRAQKKEQRKQLINSATITTLAGNIFDADETSQQRMHRAIEIMNDVETIEWILADNTMGIITRAELREALRLAFLKQSSQWAITNAT